MQRPQPLPNCPVGLEYLTQIDRLLIEQKVDLLEAFSGWEQNNKYAVKNAMGQQVYYAFEETDACMRLYCGSKRGFNINIVDNFNQRILKVSREFRCLAGCPWFAGCCDFCTHEVKIESALGEILGYVKQSRSLFQPCFDILDADLSKIVKIEGPICVFDGWLCESEFKVLTVDGQTQCGKVTKRCGDFVREVFTNADTFTIECK
jgi:hypothetical protein